jgi:hypothetical protein
MCKLSSESSDLKEKTDKVTGTCRSLNNMEFHDLHSSSDITGVIKTRRMRWVRHVAHKGERKGSRRVLVGNPERKRPIGRSRRRWEDNLKMDIQEVGEGALTRLIWLMIWTGDRLL